MTKGFKGKKMLVVYGLFLGTRMNQYIKILEIWTPSHLAGVLICKPVSNTINNVGGGLEPQNLGNKYIQLNYISGQIVGNNYCR